MNKKNPKKEEGTESGYHLETRGGGVHRRHRLLEENVSGVGQGGLKTKTKGPDGLGGVRRQGLGQKKSEKRNNERGVGVLLMKQQSDKGIANASSPANGKKRED